MDVGSYIKELRISHNLTQTELGEKLGVKKSAVHKWESGIVTNLKRDTIKKMATLFGVSPASFVDVGKLPPYDDNYIAKPLDERFIAKLDNIPTSKEKDLLLQKVSSLDDEQAALILRVLELPLDKLKALNKLLEAIG